MYNVLKIHGSHLSDHSVKRLLRSFTALVELIAKIKSPVEPATIAPEGAVLVTVELFNVLSPKLRTRFTDSVGWVWCNISWREERINTGRITIVRVLTATRPHITNNAWNMRIKILSCERIVWLVLAKRKVRLDRSQNRNSTH